jgi:hypothetical protein
MAKFSFSKKFNTEKLFNIETEEFDYMSLEDLANASANSEEPPVFVIRGIYINRKSLYDPAPVVALDDTYVNLPSHLLPACEQILHDRLAIDAINQGKCGFRIEKYHQKRFNKDCYSIEWVDILPDKKPTATEEPNGEPTEEPNGEPTEKNN